MRSLDPSRACEHALRADGLRVSLGGAEVLREVSLQVPAGEVVGVLGPSGAGKSTLFRVLAGDLKPSAGAVWLGTRNISREPMWARARAGLGYVPQTPSVLFDLSVRKNIRTFERAARVPPQAVARRAEQVDLGARLDVAAGELSGGERRRLELLRALIAAPRVLICDEPLAGVDPAAAMRMGRLLRQHAADGMAIVLADHRVREALPFCDQALLLVDGKVEARAAPAEFSELQAVRRRYLG